MRIHLSIRWARVLLTMVSLLVSLAVAEVITRVLLPRPGFQKIPTQSQIIPHPTRGFAYSPNNPGFTNSLGLRDDPIAPDERVIIGSWRFIHSRWWTPNRGGLAVTIGVVD